MIGVYAYGTGNGLRPCVAMAECGLEHTVNKVDLAKGEHMTPEFLKLNPLGEIPVIVDHDGPGGKPLTISQSAAIVLYAAEKSGKFLPSDAAARALAMQWLMFDASDVAGTNNAIFMTTMRAPEKVPAVIGMFEDKLYGKFGALTSVWRMWSTWPARFLLPISRSIPSLHSVNRCSRRANRWRTWSAGRLR